MSDSPTYFDPSAPQERRLIRTRSRPWHRSLDPGVDTGDDEEETEGNIEAITLALQTYREMRATFDGDTPEEEELRGVLDAATAMILRIAPLQPDRPGRGGGIDGVGGVIEYG